MVQLRILVIIVIYLWQQHLLGQGVAIGTEEVPPHPSAILDIQSTTQGILIPRMTQAERQAIVDPAPGLLVYQTDISPGLYTNNGESWTVLTAGPDVWHTMGNTNTNPDVQFLGTTDASPLRFRLNNLWAGEINSMKRNVCIGDSSGISLVTGQFNTSFGHKSLRLNAAGSQSTAIGYQALSKSTGSSLTAVGFQALMNNTTGQENTAIGSFSLSSNSSGSWNTALGKAALQENLTGAGNTAAGFRCLQLNLNGIDNTAFGNQAMIGNTDGNENTANGALALANNVHGDNNTAIGAESLFWASQSENTAVGYAAARGTTIGFNNTAIGSGALSSNTTGSNNVSIGRNSGNSLVNIFNSISIGNHNYLNGADNQVFIGNLGIMWNGGNVAWSTFSDARVKTDIREDVVGLDFIKRLRPVTYHRDIDMQAQLTGNTLAQDVASIRDIEQIKFSGFLAQEVEAAALASGYSFSGVSTPKNNQNLYTLSYESFVVPIVKAMQEQQEIIEAQEQKILSLEERLSVLESREK